MDTHGHAESTTDEARPPSTDLTLWGSQSVRAMRAHWMLMELQLRYEFIPVRPRVETESGEFRAINPRGKVPVLRHGTLVLTESAAIVHYLVERFPTPPGIFGTTDAASRARVNEWSYFVMTELDATALYVIRRHVQLKHLFGDAPAAVEAAGAYFEAQVAAMCPRIASSSPFLLGEDLSAADILLVTCLDWASNVGLALPEEVHTYHQQVRARAAYGAAHSRNFGAEV